MIYDKINSLFKRDSKNIIIPTEYSQVEFEYLNDCFWECAEKIDGTNTKISISITTGIDGPKYNVEYLGRTPKSIMPTHLNAKMHSLFDNIDWSTIFPNVVEGDLITIFGEGYGYKIQTGGEKYIKDDVSFIMFDINYNGRWLNRKSLEDIAPKLGIELVPIIGYFTIPQAMDFVKDGFKSTIAKDPSKMAEGLVLKTPMGLLDRNGKRIITKIKTCDFDKYKAVYGEEPTVRLEIK